MCSPQFSTATHISFNLMIPSMHESTLDLTWPDTWMKAWNRRTALHLGFLMSASVNQMWRELCSCHSTLCLYSIWQAVTLVSPCCHTCCKNHYPLEMLFCIKNLCWRYLTPGLAGQTECETECFHAAGGSLPSTWNTDGMLADRQGVDTIIAPMRLCFTFK